MTTTTMGDKVDVDDDDDDDEGNKVDIDGNNGIVIKYANPNKLSLYPVHWRHSIDK